MASIFSKLRLTKNVLSGPKSINALKNTGIRSISITRPHTNQMSSEEEKANKAHVDMGKETIFDKIIARKVRADIIFEDENYLAFKDVNPQAPIHFLLIPKRRIAMLDDASDNDKEMIGQMILIAKTLGKKLAPNGYRLVINNGKDGCQSVYHLHVHILGGRRMHWPPG